MFKWRAADSQRRIRNDQSSILTSLLAFNFWSFRLLFLDPFLDRTAERAIMLRVEKHALPECRVLVGNTLGPTSRSEELVDRGKHPVVVIGKRVVPLRCEQ